MATDGKKASDKVETAMRERNAGTLKSGGSGKTVTSRKQAIAIGLSQARREGAKVPAKRHVANETAKKTATKTATKKVSAGKTATTKTAAKTSATKKAAAKGRPRAAKTVK